MTGVVFVPSKKTSSQLQREHDETWARILATLEQATKEAKRDERRTPQKNQ